jgi:glycine cleavage system regulatory protein
MLLFSRLQVVHKEKIHVPAHIRAALGLHRDIRVYLSTVDASEASLRNEIIVSPVPIKARDELWRLRATFQDRPGILAELFQLLREEKIEIVSTRAHTLEQSGILSVELLLNTEFYQSPYLIGSPPRESAAGPTLPDLRARIVATFINDLDRPFGSKPILSIRRNIPLYRSKMLIKDIERARVKEEGITLPENLLESIRQSFLQTYPAIANLKGDLRLPLASIVGDAENSVLRVLVFYRNTGHVHIRVRACGSKADCFLEVTEALRGHNFNILQMYARILRNKEGDESLMDFLLYLPAEVDKDRNDTKLQKYIFGIFKSSRIQTLGCDVMFPDFLTLPASGAPLTPEGQS